MTLYTFLDNIIVLAPSILYLKGLGMNKDFPKKVIIKSQSQFMYGFDFYGSDITPSNLRDIPQAFDIYLLGKLQKYEEDFFKFCVLLRKSKLYLNVKTSRFEIVFSLITVQFLAGFEIKTVRTVLNSRGIHRLLVSFRANLITYNFQTFFLPQGKKL